jgi:membrane fusion protein, multidrug efflux system
MLKAEHIECPNDQSASYTSDAPLHDRSPGIRVAEVREDRRETPSIAPAPAVNRPKPIATVVDRWSRSTGKQRIRWIMFALLPVALLAGAYAYVTGGQVMTTDDAYVEADDVGVSTDVSGIVQDVDVGDNQHVAAGQVLYRLDPRQFQIALDNAKANLAQTALTIESMKRDYQRMLSDITAQQALVDLDQVNFDRDAALLTSNSVAKSIYDQAHFTLQSDQSKLVSLKRESEVELAKLAGNPDIPVTDHPQYQQVKAQVDEAQRELDHTVVKAPFAGIVTNVPAIAPGKYLAASATAFYLVAADHAWVEAEPKETQLTYVQPGQPVTITVDVYPGIAWHGIVESISPAAAQEFQLLPAQNTSGNWVKVVQRIPLRVRVDTRNPGMPPLRAGMSVEIAVNTGHARGFPQALTELFRRGGRAS